MSSFDLLSAIIYRIIAVNINICKKIKSQQQKQNTRIYIVNARVDFDAKFGLFDFLRVDVNFKVDEK